MIPCGEEADLLILMDGSCRSVILATPGRMYGPGIDEGLPEPVVEPLRKVPGELEVLALIFPDRHLIGVVEQDVGRLQDRVSEQAHAGRVRAAPGRLVLELHHPAGLAEPGDARQHPGQLGVLGHMALHEHNRAVRIQAGGEELRRRDSGPAAQVGWLLRKRDRVQVDYAVHRVMGVLQRHPLAQRAQVVADMERIGGRLDTGEDAGPGHAKEV